MGKRAPDSESGCVPAKGSGISLPMKIFAVAVVMVCGLGVGIGVGFGIGKERYDTGSSPKTTQSPPTEVPVTETPLKEVVTTAVPTGAPPTSVPPTPLVPSAPLLITEYMENGNNTAAEVTNIGDSYITFAATPLTFAIYSVGSADATQNIVVSTGVLPPGGVLVLAHSAAEVLFLQPTLSAAVVEKRVFAPNGGAVGLVFGGVLIDLVGVVPMETSWLKGLTIRRGGENVANPEGFASLVGSVFTAVVAGATNGFGCVGLAACAGSIAETDAPVIIPVEQCGLTAVKISEVQGASDESPLVGQAVVVEALYIGSNGGGYFLQEELEDYDGDDATSEGLYVKGTAPNVPINTLVRVTGTVEESHGMTALTDAGPATECTLGGTVPSATNISIANSTALEAFEGMLITVVGDMVITDTFNTWKYGEITCGPQIRWAPSNRGAPFTAAYNDTREANKEGTFVVEDSSSSSYPSVLEWYPHLPLFQKPINIGAQVSGVTGPLMYSYSTWRTVPMSTITIEDNRPSSSSVEGFNRTDALVVASFNVLNYFNGKVVDGKTTFSYSENRGATGYVEFDLQATKIVNSLVVMDAAIVGLMEIENDGFGSDSALASLVERLNAKFTDTAKHYSFVSLVNETQIGSDVVTCGIIYRPALVETVSDSWIIPMPQQKFMTGSSTTLKQMRPALVQTFREIASGENITVVVNHMKSKGSECYEDVRENPSDIDVIQGSCSAFRVSAAVTLGEALQGGDVSMRVMLLGDFNSNSAEDPIAVLTDYTPGTRGYTIRSAGHIVNDTAEAEGSISAEDVTKTYKFRNIASEGHSYIGFGLVTSLDFAFANEYLAMEVQSAKHWNINSNELYQMTYSEAYKRYPGYANGGVFRSSDHDPVVVALKLKGTTDSSSDSSDAGSTPTGTPIVVITEYMEGGGNNKAVEIGNVGGGVVDFSVTPYVVAVFRKGNSVMSESLRITSGTLVAGEVLVVAHSSAADLFDMPNVQNTRIILFGSLGFNGDDAVALLDGVGTIIDLVGVIPMSTKFLPDVTLRRPASDTTPNPTGFASLAESVFVSNPKDTMDGFGCLGAVACGEAPPVEGGTPAPTTALGLCGDGIEVKISEVQGASDESPLVGQAVVVEALYIGSNGGGYFLQEELEDYDDDDATSEGLYVKGTAPNVPINTLVRVTGTVEESYWMTALTDAGPATECTLGGTVPSATNINIANSTALEAFEGMLITVVGDMVITDTFNTWKYGEIICGPQIRWKPSDRGAPFTTVYNDTLEANKEGTFVVEDSSSSSYPSVLEWYPHLPMFQKPINIGAQVSGVTGPLMYSYSTWRTVPQSTITLENNRPSKTSVEGFNRTDALVVASFNVLNYFNGKVVDGKTTFSYSENRGATGYVEFDLQATKIVNSLVVMDAAIVGLMEIENDGFDSDSALASLVDRLNAKFTDTDQHYSFVSLANETQIGSDAITCGIIYRPALVETVSDSWIIPMPQQKFMTGSSTTLKQMRPALVQTFREIASGENITVVVNHMKSKGSECYEDVRENPSDIDVIQGSCSAFRVSAAVTLGEALEKADVAIRVMLLGDFNSNSAEDPMAVITDYTPDTHGYTIRSADYIVDDITEAEGSISAKDVTKTYKFQNIGHEGYSYIFSGEVSSLDFALGNERVVMEVQSAKHWNINSNELYQMTYSEAYKRYPGYANEDVFRSSDHDPVVVALQMRHIDSTASPYDATSAPATPAPPTVAPDTPAPDTDVPAPVAGGLIFTEYMEGSGNNKAVEIANMGSTTIDFSVTNYQIVTYTSGNSASQQSAYSLTTGTLAPGEVMIAVHGSVDASFNTQASVVAVRSETASLSFNGNDAVGLLDKDGVVTDLIGFLGSMGNIIKDQTIRRDPSDTGPNPTGFTTVASSTWTAFTKNDHTGFGCTGLSACP